MTRRDPIFPLILSALLAILFHLFAFSTLPRLVAFIPTNASPSTTNNQLTSSNSIDHRRPLPSSTPIDQQKPAPKHQPKHQLRPGSDQGQPVFTVAWIPHEDPRNLVAPQAATQQPALQNKMAPVPDAPLLADPDEPQPTPADPALQPPAQTPPHQATAFTPSPLIIPLPPTHAASSISEQPINLIDSINDLPLSIRSNPPLQIPPQSFSIAPAFTQEPNPENPPSPFSLQPPTNPQQPKTITTPKLQPLLTPATTNSPLAAPALSNASPPHHPDQPPRLTPASPPTGSPRSDRQSQPFALNSSNLKVQPGAVLTGQGIEIKTVLPRISVIARYLIPHNPVAVIVFDRSGHVRQAKLIKTTGYENWDGPILASLYKWRASGKLLQEIDDSYELQIQLILINE